MIKDFELLKRTYPKSKFKRVCDGYIFIMNNTTLEERKALQINDFDLQQYINKDEEYIYQVAKEMGVFKVLSISYSNYSIIRKHLFGTND